MLGERRDGPLAEALAQTLAPMRSADALGLLTGVGVRATPAHAAEQVLADEWLKANRFLDEVRQTPYGPVVNRPYATFSRTPAGYTRPDPGLGEHSMEVLADWGFDPARIAALADQGVVMCLS
jgi:crotonobetainyl-CoA:carnitine CoA-transferase CaiB-like acyl-CoA transferase